MTPSIDDTLPTMLQRQRAHALRWRRASSERRLDVLVDAGRRMAAREPQLKRSLGKDGLSESLAARYLQWMMRQASADYLRESASQLHVKSSDGSERMVCRPDGLVALVTPANSSTINASSIFPIALAGNAVAVRAPPRRGHGVDTIVLECVGEALEAAGYGRECVSLFRGSTRAFLEQVYRTAEVDTIVFFGNDEAGRDVSERGTAAGKKVVLELAGSDCMVVWSDADLDACVASATRGFEFSSLPCAVPKHFLVHPAIRDAFVRRFATAVSQLRTIEADPKDGALVPVDTARCEAIVRELSDAGTIEQGGFRADATLEPAADGAYFAPTLVSIAHSSSLAHAKPFADEINYPILPIVTFVGDDERVASDMSHLLDAIPFGLRVSLWSSDETTVATFLQRVPDVGLFAVNHDHAAHPRWLSPWGGRRRSGGPHGELHRFAIQTSHWQGIVGASDIAERSLIGTGRPGPRSPESKVELDVRGRRATITLNRPKRHNAVDRELAEQFADAVDRVWLECEAGKLSSLVLTGAGPSFCSGADLKLLRELDARGARRFMQDMTWSLRKLERLPIVTLAQVRGHCVGGGFEIALHCDFITAAEGAQFGLPEVRHGLCTTAGSMGRLTRAVGVPRARQWLLNAQPISAAVAHQWGLVTDLVPEDQLDASVDRWAAKLEKTPPEGIELTKSILRPARDDDTWLAELEAFERLMRTRETSR